MIVAVSEERSLLPGGGQNYGKLRRDGDTVVRPVGEHSPSVQAFLRHLEAQGFDGAPRVLHSSPTEEVLGFIEGDVPVPPEPPAGGWPVVSEARAASVGDLLRRFHGAARTFVPPESARWNGGVRAADANFPVCHNDPVVGNIVFRDQRAVALIDFDFARPNDPLRDLAAAAQHWVPLADPDDFLGESGAWSASRRLMAMCESYGLAPSHIPGVLDLVDSYLERGRRGVLARVQAGQERFIAYWKAGLGDRLERALIWLRANRSDLAGPG